jgi:hypothetical protein
MMSTPEEAVNAMNACLNHHRASPAL